MKKAEDAEDLILFDQMVEKVCAAAVLQTKALMFEPGDCMSPVAAVLRMHLWRSAGNSRLLQFDHTVAQLSAQAPTMSCCVLCAGGQQTAGKGGSRSSS